MTFEMALVFAVVAGALFLFAAEVFRHDIAALLILVTLVAIPLLFHSDWLLARGIDLKSAFPTVEEGLSGLSNRATVTVLGMFILSAGVQRSGLIRALGRRLIPLVGQSELRQLLAIALLIGPISGLINNTAAVAMAIPLVIDMASRSGTRASLLLMAVSFFGMIGGTLTLIGTSTNILASSLLKNNAAFGRELELFEFSHLGLLVFAAGLLYFLTIGRWLVPSRDRSRLSGGDEEIFTVELALPGDSPLIGKAVADSDFEAHSGVTLHKLVRDGASRIKRAGTTPLEPDDVLVVRASLRQIMELLKSSHVELLSETGRRRSVRADSRLVPVLLRNRMLFSGRPASKVGFWDRYGARLIGLDTGSLRKARIADEPLHVGEVVLLNISKTNLQRLRNNPDVVVLDEIEDEADSRRMWYAGGIVAAVVLAAALTPLPIVLTVIAGVISMVAFGCLGRDELYSGVSWDVIFLLAGVIPLGIAMSKSGAAAWLGDHLASVSGGLHPVLILMLLYFVTTMLTELVSNNASVVILVPVALALAESLGMAPLPPVLAVMFAASTSFLTPIGYQTNTMIYGTGLYGFSDFAKVGAPLNLLLMAVTCAGLWLFWGL